MLEDVHRGRNGFSCEDNDRNNNNNILNNPPCVARGVGGDLLCCVLLFILGLRSHVLGADDTCIWASRACIRVPSELDRLIHVLSCRCCTVSIFVAFSTRITSAVSTHVGYLWPPSVRVFVFCSRYHRGIIETNEKKTTVKQKEQQTINVPVYPDGSRTSVSVLCRECPAFVVSACFPRYIAASIIVLVSWVCRQALVIDLLGVYFG